MMILSDKEYLKNKILLFRALNKSDDAVRLMGNHASAENITVIDKANNEEAHHDAFQLIPVVKGKYNQQFACGVIKSPRIARCSVYSEGSLQGIFSSDGIIENAYISGNVIETQSEHKITLNGVINGFIDNNFHGDGSPIYAVLNNLRIGGGVANIWVKSFKHQQYKPVHGKYIIDNRGKEHHKTGTYIEEFDLFQFLCGLKDIKYKSTKDYCLALGDLAIACSR